MPLETYGCKWPKDATQTSVEIGMIRKGGQWESKGKTYGLGLFHLEAWLALRL